MVIRQSVLGTMEAGSHNPGRDKRNSSMLRTIQAMNANRQNVRHAGSTWAKNTLNPIEMDENQAAPNVEQGKGLWESHGTKRADEGLRYPRLVWFLKHCPGVNFLYFVLDDQPETSDILDLLTNIALLAALVFTVSGAIPAMVSVDELELADCRFNTWGEYGCYNFNKFHSYYPSKAFANRTAIATYSMALVLLMSILMIFGLSTLSSAADEDDQDKKDNESAKLIGGGGAAILGGSSTTRQDGVPLVALQKWWNVMRWLAFIEMALLIIGIQFMFLSMIYVFMIKFPSVYLRDRCRAYGYELLNSPLGVVNSSAVLGYPAWTENEYTGKSHDADGWERPCDVYVHNNRNDDGSFKHFDDKGGLFVNLFTASSMSDDPSQDWWSWAFVGILPVLGATIIVAGYAAYRAEKHSAIASKIAQQRKKWVKVLYDGDEEVPMFYPKSSNKKSKHKLLPRRLQPNEVFLLLGKANSHTWEVLSVPWDPIPGYPQDQKYDDTDHCAPRFLWPWAFLHTVYELATMHKHNLEYEIATKSEKFAGPLRQASANVVDNDVTDDAAVFSWQTFVKLSENLAGAALTAEQLRSAKIFFDKLLSVMDNNDDKTLHLAELVGPLGVLDIRRAITAINNKQTVERPQTAVGARNSADDIANDEASFGRMESEEEFKELFPFAKKPHHCLYYPNKSGKQVTLWKLLQDEFPHVPLSTLLRLNNLERGFVKVKHFSAPREGLSAADAFMDDFGVNEYYLGTQRALEETVRDDVEHSVAFLHETIPDVVPQENLRRRNRSAVAPIVENPV